MAELLLDHGTHVNTKDRGNTTPLHSAVTGDHKDIVSLLLNRDAEVESKAGLGDTPLRQAIKAESKEMIKLSLEYEASVNGLPDAPWDVALKGPTEPLEKRAKQLLELQEPLSVARYEKMSKKVDLVMRVLTLSFRYSHLLPLLTWYLRSLGTGKNSFIGRWEEISALQDMVKNNKMYQLQPCSKKYLDFFLRLVKTKNPTKLMTITSLLIRIFEAVPTTELQALLMVAVLVGSETKVAAVEQEWAEGDVIMSRAFAQWASIAYRRNAEEHLHRGIRKFMDEFDASIRSGRRIENVVLAVVCLTAEYGVIENRQTRPVEYVSTVIAEFVEGYIGGSFEDVLFTYAIRACVNELAEISQKRDSYRLLLFLSSLLRFAECSKREEGQKRFLTVPLISCLTLCQAAPDSHRWLISEAIPITLGSWVAEKDPGLVRKLAYKTLVECLIIGNRYGLIPPIKVRQAILLRLKIIEGVDFMLDQALDI